MRTTLILVLEAFLGLALLVLLWLQAVYLPAMARDVVLQYPELERLGPPVQTLCTLIVVCAQVILIATGILLALILRDRIFQPIAFRFVDLIIGAFIVAGLLAASANAVIAFGSPGVGGPALAFLVLATIGCFALAALVGVLRGLLSQATRDRAELAEVV